MTGARGTSDTFLRALGLAAVLVSLAAAARAEPPRMITEDEAVAWRAIGRLNVAGNRQCTATLIAEKLILTSAHCLFNRLTGKRARPQDIRFVAGQYRDTYAALRGVTATAVLPGYAYDPEPDLALLARDLALLMLDAPVLAADATPLPVAGPAPGLLDVIGYGRDRAYIPALRAGCGVMAAQGTLLALDCDVVPGLSGAPVLGPGPVVVAVVSASVDSGGLIAVNAAPQLATLKAELGLTD